MNFFRGFLNALGPCIALWTIIPLGIAHAAIALPPEQYDHPFDGRLIVETISWWDVADRCRPIRDAWACSWRFQDPQNPGKFACHVIYPKLGTGGIDEDELVSLIRHETGHCNSWPADHPGGRFE